MDSKALINETLKYLETDGNNNPKYRFEIYKTGMVNYYKDQIGNLTLGLKTFDLEEEKTTPVSVYTIGDLFDTVSDVKDDVMTNIQALPGTLENIKVSLKQLGFSALDNTINTLKTAVIPIEVVQTIETIYRVAKPLVEKIVNIASIKFYFENAALVAQDVLQYLSRIAVSTARNFLDRLWNIFMDTPIFAIYENEDTVNLAETYANLSNVANNVIDSLARDADAIYEMITYINGSEFTTYEPKYNEFGITTPEDIIDVYHDVNTRKIYIATKKAIYQVNENFSTSKITDIEVEYHEIENPEGSPRDYNWYELNDDNEYVPTEDEEVVEGKTYYSKLVLETDILKLYVFNDEIHFIIDSEYSFDIKKWNGSKVVNVGSIPKNSADDEVDIIFSNPLFLYIVGTTNIYNGEGVAISSSVLNLAQPIIYQSYDIEHHIIYYIGLEDNKYYLWQISSAEDEDGQLTYYPVKLYDYPVDVYGLRYFNNTLYVIAKEDDKYLLFKLGAGKYFKKQDYTYENITYDNSDKNIIWNDGDYATDGSNIFKVSNDNKLTYKYNIGAANCVTTQRYNKRDYLVCTGGIKIYVSLDTENYLWYEKIIDTFTTRKGEDGEELEYTAPDNMAGCLWFDNKAYGKEFIAYSQQNIYLFNSESLGQLFNFIDERAVPELLSKEHKKFMDWFKDSDEETPYPFITPTSTTKIDDNCIITSLKVVDDTLYVALFNPSSSNIKCGIYPCSISRFNQKVEGENKIIDKVVIDYDHPVYSSGKKTKIYSFNKKENQWYYTDGKTLYNTTTNSITNLGLSSSGDGALSITDDINIYTAKAFLKSAENSKVKDVSSLANYASDELPEIASTRNIMMFSDKDYIYSIVDNGENKIKYDIYQICYKKGADDFKLVQSNDAAFIVSGQIIKKLPFYSTIVSSEYGCGYNVDTTPNSWYGAAPYYFASNILNTKTNSIAKDLFLYNFKENFKFELEKLLTAMPDAFLNYMETKLKDELDETDIKIEGDDGQILNVIKDSVASTTAVSLGMYIQEKFMEKIGDDTTYNTFANTVYNACKADTTNNMTKQFYDVFYEFAKSVISDALNIKNLGRNGLSNALLRYYQNHKAEWAESMTELIDVDFVKPDIYELPLSTFQTLTENTMRFSYNDNDYKFEFIPNPSANFSPSNIISGYYCNKEFYNGVPFVLTEDTEAELGKNYYTKVNDHKYDKVENPSGENPKEQGWYEETTATVIDEKIKAENGDYYDETENIICYYNSEDDKYYRYKLMDYTPTTDTEVVGEHTYYEKTGDDVYIYSETSDITEENKPYFSRELMPTADVDVEERKDYFSKNPGAFNFEPTTEADYGGDYTLDENNHYVYDTTAAERYFVTFAPFTIEFAPTTDTIVIDGKDYYELQDGEYVKVADPSGNPSEQGWYEVSEESEFGQYILNDDGHFEYSETTEDVTRYYPLSWTSNNGILKLDSYYEKGQYVKTEDENIVDGKAYYSESFVKAQGTISNTIQYYEYQYVKTEDTEVNRDKNYYQFVDLSYEPQILLDNGYIPAPEGTTEQKYKIHYTALDGDFDENETYFITPDGITYYEAEELDIQGGPYYYIDGMAADNDGDFIKISDPSQVASSYYNKVQDPKIDELPTYYELEYVKIPTPDTIEGKYIKEYVSVDAPSLSELYSYYEKSDEYLPAENINYAYNEFGATIGIINDRNYYKAIYTNGDYTIVENPEGNPLSQNWYEYSFVQVEAGTIVNPYAEGLYERTANDITFTKVESPSGNPSEHGWFEYKESYSTLYDDGKVYIDLKPSTSESYFPTLDNAWHKMFYNALDNISDNLPEDFEDAKEYAIRELGRIDYKFQPAWQWKALITQSVMELYIPTQGEQYKKIILDSNMYPIQWNELPVGIDNEAFDYALTALLYAIKQRLITNVMILVDNGQVRCFSCVDASSVIKKIIDRNASIWSRQGKKIKSNIESSESVSDIKKALKATETYDPTLFLLENILNEQSKLYAKYLDMIIDEQVIRDNDTEVML